MPGPGPAAPSIDVVVYSRKDCHLCDEAKAVISALAPGAARPFTVREVDIDTDPALVAAYNDEVPVIFIGGRKAFKYHVDPAEFARKLEHTP